MGASIYTLQWAEQQWERIKRGEKLDKHDQRALLLVYRQAWLKLKGELEGLQSGALQEALERVEKAAEASPEIVYRDSTWRVRDDDESDERDL